MFFAKSSDAAVQTVLHALFLPNRVKLLESSDPKDGTKGQNSTPEYLLGGSLYAECAKVYLPGNAEKKYGNEDVGRAIWENLEQELARWTKKEETKSEK